MKETQYAALENIPHLMSPPTVNAKILVDRALSRSLHKKWVEHFVDFSKAGGVGTAKVENIHFSDEFPMQRCSWVVHLSFSYDV